MNILIVDDEEPARKRLVELVGELGEQYRVIGEAADGKQAIDMVQHHPVDLVLMDIHMPGLDGLGAARILSQQELPPAVVFTTAYSEHALSAFEVNAADYLLKPVRRDKLREALEKVVKPTRTLQQPDQGNEEWLTSRYRGGLQRIPMASVYYFRADNKYVLVRYEAGEALLEESLKTLESRFPERLMRVHRKALVVPERIKGLERTPDGQFLLLFQDIDDRLEISRRHLPEVRRLLVHRQP